MITDISPRVRNLIAGLALLAFVLVLLGEISGVDWIGFVLQLTGVTRT